MSVIREDVTNCEIRQLMAPTGLQATKDDLDPIDVSGFESATFAITFGTEGPDLAANKYIEIELHESVRSDGGFASCADGAVIPSVAGTNTGTVLKLIAKPDLAAASHIAGYKGHKRYVKPVLRFTGAHNADTTISIAAILRGPKYRPVSS